MRWASSLVTACGLLLAVLVAAAAPARAGSTMVVVDGAAAREDETLRDQARRLTQALVAAGDDVRVVVVAWRAGRVDVAHDEDGTAFGAREAWAVAEDAVPLDVREVFRVALERHRALKPLRLITLGPFEDDPNVTNKKFPGNVTESYRSRHPLRVVEELEDWEGHSPEALQTMLDNLARLREQGLDVIED